jgi:hypothetical protein
MKDNIPENTCDCEKEPCNCTCDTTEAVPFTRVQIAGNAFVVTSKLSLETIKKLEKLDPDTLCLKRYEQGEEIEIFKIMSGKTSSISTYGIVFSEANKAGNAIATSLFPEDIKDKKEYIKERFGKTLFILDELEAQAGYNSAHIERMFNDLDKTIVEV